MTMTESPEHTTDARIQQQAVRSEVQWTPELEDTAIGVSGVTTAVDEITVAEWAYQRKAAQRSVQMLPMVRGVVNQLVAHDDIRVVG
ncbi:hypothetical protein N1027_00210 [Herbiconiux sp. CPCC 205763]|uniref:BON domain-containing protein n=1 Tax=Herbiconiux aconitum TaxID=2970913 RepID=A0ABT2GKB0_9MICO|nr:hypothetical protein [Herbiconiux aconitum]MCS5716556.1 hypothetical protein [Herbiconiux aconitum]